MALTITSTEFQGIDIAISVTSYCMGTHILFCINAIVRVFVRRERTQMLDKPKSIDNVYNVRSNINAVYFLNIMLH